MTTAQSDAIEKLRQKYNVTKVVPIANGTYLGDGTYRVEVTNGPTPFLFVSQEGEVEDDDGYAVSLAS